MSFGFVPFGGTSFGDPGGGGSTTASLTDTATFGTTLTYQVIYAILESAHFGDTLVPLAQRLAVVSEGLGLSAPLTATLSALLSETVTLTDTLTGRPIFVAALADALVLSGVATNTMNALALLSDAMALADVLRMVQDGSISDSMDLADALDVKLSAFEALVVTADFADSLIGLGVFTVVVSDAAALGDTLTGKAALLASIAEGLAFTVSFNFDDEPYLGIAMNTATHGVSEYTNYRYNSLTAFKQNGKLYGAAAGGLYRLEGADDAGSRIDWRVKTGLTNFGSGREKRMESAYIAHCANGRLALKCTVSAPNATTGRNEYREYWYEFVGVAGSAGVREGRFSIGRGLKAVFWSFELANLDPTTDGDGLDVLSLRPLILDRRIP